MQKNLQRTPVRVSLLASICLLGALGDHASAASLAVQARGPDGKPVRDAVVALYPAGGQSSEGAAEEIAEAVMDQKDHEFVPHVLPVRVGTLVQFPNSDQVRHHVYSFSEAKRFELRLYSGVPAEPVLFDRPGVVVLGCNIHDHMLGYVHVLDTPYFARTGPDGRAELRDLPRGTFRLEVWHPRTSSGHEVVARTLELQEDPARRVEYVDTAVAPREVHPDADDALSPLERKFRRHRKQ